MKELENSVGVDQANIAAEKELTLQERMERADKRHREEAGVYDPTTGEHETFEWNTIIIQPKMHSHPSSHHPINHGINDQEEILVNIKSLI